MKKRENQNLEWCRPFASDYDGNSFEGKKSLLTVEIIDCCKQGITEIAELPPALYIFQCYNNQLAALPKLPTVLPANLSITFK